MRARRLIAVSPDEAFGAQLASALVTVDLKVESYHDVSALGVDPLEGVLCVIHVAAGLEASLPGFLANLAPDCRIIAVLPRAGLVGVVEIMERTDRVVGMLVAEDFEPERLRAIAVRVIGGDIVGVDKVLAPGAQTHAVLCEYSERTLCRARVVAFASQCGAPKRLFAQIEQCIDEMLMNALYDAPIDETGKHVFAGVPVRTRVAQKLATNVVVQYGFDGKQLAISVRDGFGSIERDTVLRVLNKCLHAAQKIDRKAGGAGVGLYLMVNASSAVYFNVIPNVATEAICVFRIGETKQQLDAFGFFREAIDVTGTLPTERLPASALKPTQLHRPLGPRLFAAGAVASVALLAGALWYRHTHQPEPPKPPPPPATVELDTKPTGAAVDIDGKPSGETPVTLTTLPPESDITVTFTRKAFKPARIKIHVPRRGERVSHVETLAPNDAFVHLKIRSTPSGAQLIDLGNKGASADRTYTPAELDVEAGKEQRFMLTMPNRVPVLIPPFTPQKGQGVIDKIGELKMGVNLHVDRPAGGRFTVEGAPTCVDVAVPGECTLDSGTYTVDFVAPDGTKRTKAAELIGDDVPLNFD